MNQPYSRIHAQNQSNDSVWNGAAIGVGAYAATQAVVHPVYKKRTGKSLTQAFGGKGKTALAHGVAASVWGGIGAGIDAMNR